MQKVQAKIENIIIPTYEAAEYEEMPMFAFNRIHQGTTGNPFPHRVINKVRRDSRVDKTYTAVCLENDYLDVLILPELGGRIFAARDKTNGYDFFYRQHVIKPALIGIYGLWISGGLEFNWPRHHRPSTFMPTDFVIERLENGGVVLWLSEHDPLFRMKGMVGIVLYPGRAVLETRMKVFNRTALPHTFHWWENAAIPVNTDFQLFFPPDVTYVNYHYRKAVGAYPVMDSYFYVQDNRGGNDIRFHRNTGMATSYFSGVSRYNFFGGYDHGKKAGVIHYASRHTAPGKKMFTWGYKSRAKAWEQALTDTDGPYVELMAGSYGDNQPDFAWIEPYETKEFSQVWYPYKELGEVQAASEQAALSYTVEGRGLRVNIYATENIPQAVLEIRTPGGGTASKRIFLDVARPESFLFPELNVQSGLNFSLSRENGKTLLDYTVEIPVSQVPEILENVPYPEDLPKADDLCLAGIHIEQYYDPAIEPVAYWSRGLEVDPDHFGCLLNLGRWHLAHQNYVEAEELLRHAVRSLTRYNFNPRDSEVLYLLALVLIEQNTLDEALDLLHKSLWSSAQVVSSSCTIAALYSRRGEYEKAEKILMQYAAGPRKNQRVGELLVSILRKEGRIAEARREAEALLRDDMLDFFLLNELRLLGDGSPADDRFKYRLDETGIDLAADYTSLGFWEDALELLEWLSRREKPTMLLLYGAGYLCSRMGKTAQAKEYYTLAAQAPRGMRFAALPFERQALENAVKIMKNDGRACNELGTLIFGIKRKTDEALGLWQEARQAAPHSPQILRNLAVGLFSRNNKDPETLSLLEEAVRLRPWDLQLIYERNLVAELQHIPPAERLEMWKNQDVAPGDWDEIYLQGVRLFNHLGEHKKALKMLMDHTFIPAEGGEAVLGAEYGNTLECLGYEALQKGKAEEALNHFAAACNSPLNIGGGSLHEVTMVPYKYGQVLCFLKLERQKEVEETCKWILRFPVDYFTQSMLPSFMYYRAMALICTGNEKEGKDLLEALKQKACKELDRKEYGQFSTTSAHSSYIPDPGEQRRVHFGILLSLAQSGLGEKEEAHRTMEEVLKLDPFKPVMKHKIQ